MCIRDRSYVPALESAGYILQIREPEWFEHRLFKGPDTDINLHVFSSGTSEIDRMLRFRDWLRTNDADRDKYAQVKRNLAKNKWRHVQPVSYTHLYLEYSWDLRSQVF